MPFGSVDEVTDSSFACTESCFNNHKSSTLRTSQPNPEWLQKTWKAKWKLKMVASAAAVTAAVVVVTGLSGAICW